MRKNVRAFNGTDHPRQKYGSLKSRQGVELWKARLASHFSTPRLWQDTYQTQTAILCFAYSSQAMFCQDEQAWCYPNTAAGFGTVLIVFRMRETIW
jgi:hypothetical protein